MPGATRRRALDLVLADADGFAAFASSLVRRWTRRVPVRVPWPWLAALTAPSPDRPLLGHPAGVVGAGLARGPGLNRNAPDVAAQQLLRSRRATRSNLAARIHMRLGRLASSTAASDRRPVDLVLVLGLAGATVDGARRATIDNV